MDQDKMTMKNDLLPMDGDPLIESIDVSFIKTENEDSNFFVVPGILQPVNDQEIPIKKESIENDGFSSLNVRKMNFLLFII